MKIFIDFDDVLFNTKKFKEDIIKIFGENGVSEKIFQKYYKGFPATSKKGELRKYNPREQIKKIKSLGIKTDKIEKDFSKLLKNAKKYIFKDGIRFLKKFEKEEMYVVSYGDKKFQEEKIKSSGIEKYFRKILIANTSKAVKIRMILRNKNIGQGEAIIFIDDRVKFLRDIKKSYPGMVTIHMKRKEGRFFEKKTIYCDFEAANFYGATKFICG